MALDLRPERYGSKAMAKGAEKTGAEILANVKPVKQTVQTSGRNPGGRVAVNDWVNRYNRVMEGVSKYDEKRNGGFTRDSSGGYLGNINSLIADYENIRDVADQFGFQDSLKYLDQLKQLQNSIGEINESFSQFEDEDAYNRHLEYWKDQEEKRNLDLDAYSREIADLEAKRDNLHWSEDLGEILKELDAQIAQKKQYLSQAQRLQKKDAFSAVADPESDQYDAAFDSKSGYVSTEQDGKLERLLSQYSMGYDDLTYEYINNQNGIRDEIKQKAGAYKKGETAFEAKGYDYMTEDEVGLYNYYYSMGGKKSAEAYLETIQADLDDRKAAGIAAGIKDRTAAELLFGVEAGLDQFKSGIKGAARAIIGDDSYVAPSAIQKASGLVREDLADDGIKLPAWLGGASLGQVGYDAITTSANMAPSIAVGMLNPTVGAATMGVSAGGSAYQEALNEGYSVDQARGYGILSGASEVVMEKVLGGISAYGGNALGKFFTQNMKNADTALKRIAKELGGSMLSEFSEEYLQEVLTPVFKNLTLGTDEEVKLVSAEALYAGLLGAITGGIMEGPSAIAGSRNATQLANNSTPELSNATETAGKSTPLPGNATADNAAAVTEESSEVVAENATTTAGAATGKNPLQVSQSAKVESIIKENADNDESSSVRVGVSKTETVQQTADIESFAQQFGTQANEVRRNYLEGQLKHEPENLQEYQVGFMAAYTIGWNGGKVESLSKHVPYLSQSQREIAFSLGRDAAAAQKAAETKAATAKAPTTKASLGQTAQLVAEDGSNGGTVTIAEIVSIDDSGMTLRLEDGRTVTDEDLDFPEGAEVYSTVMELGMDSESANAIVKASAAASIPRAAVAEGIETAYHYGKYGYGMDALLKAKEAAEIPEIILQASYQAGEKRRQQRRETAQTEENRATSKATAPDRRGKVHFHGKSDTLNDVQKESLRGLEWIADLTGAQIHVEDMGDSEGLSRVNGLYDPADDSIHIDLRAGSDGAGTLLYTAAHEFVHRMRQNNEAAFYRLADFLVEQYGKKDISTDALVKQQMADAAKDGIELNYDEAFEEMVADAMEAMFTDTDALAKMEKLKTQDRRLWQEIKDFVLGLAEKIKAAYARLKPDSAEARYVLQMKESIDQIAQLFAEGVMTEGIANNDSTNTKVKYSFAGRGSATADRSALQQAEELAQQGVDNETIRQRTGWYKGMDGQWRYEIDDSQMEISDEIINYMQLGELMQHEKLYAAYPDLADISIVFQGLEAGVNGSYHPQFDSINLSYRLKNDPVGLKDALVHEIQHAIQHREGFTNGATAASWDRKIKAGFDSRRAADIRKAQETERELRRIQDEEPEFYRDMVALDAMTPDLPRGEIDWETLEKIEDDPVEWRQYDARREELEAKYGDTKVWDMNDLLYQREQAAKNIGRSGVELYFDTAGEIEARDASNRRSKTPEQRKSSPPRLGNEDTVFAERNTASHAMTEKEIAAVQRIGRVSVNSFTSQDIQATERLARRYWTEMGTKSPFFRAWFGDWRKNDQTNVLIANQKGDTRGVQHNDDTGWDIHVSGKVFNESRHRGPKNQAALPYLPYINDIVSKAVLLDSYGIGTGKEKSPNSLLMHSLYAVADIGNGPEVLKLYVEEMSDPNAAETAKRAYQLQNIEKQQLGVQGSGNVPSPIRPTATIANVADLFAAVKQNDTGFSPNSPSKVVNADGMPLVVYHGSKNSGFHEFRYSKEVQTGSDYGEAYYFTSDRKKATGYSYDVAKDSRVTKYRADREVLRKRFLETRSEEDKNAFLNYRYEGKDIHDLISDESYSTPGGEVKEVYLSLKKPLIVDAGGRYYYEVYQTYFDDARTNGNDGIIVKNVIDNPRGAARPIDVYIAFSPNQIKSATENIGTYDGINPDIRYSRRKQAETEALQEQNKKLQEDVTRLKELVKLQGQVTNGKILKPSSVEAAAKYLKKLFHTYGDTKELAQKLNGLYEYIASDPELTWEGVKEQAAPIVQWLQDNEKFQRDQYAQDVLDTLKGQSFRLDETQLGEVKSQYGSLKEYRMAVKNMASSKSTQSLDQLWQELSGQYPDVFSPDTSASDMPLAFAEAVERLEGMESTETAMDWRMKDQAMLEAVYDSYWRVSGLETVADKYSKKLFEIRGKHYEKMAELRKDRNQKLKELRESKKQSVKAVRENRNKAAEKKKIHKTISQLNKLLFRGNKKQNVKKGMEDFAAAALASAEILFADNISNEDMILNGIGTQVDAKENRLIEEVRALLQKRKDLYNLDAASQEMEDIVFTGESESYAQRMAESEKLDRKISEKMRQLKGVFERERNRLNEATVSGILEDLAKAYKSLGSSDALYIRAATDERVYQYLTQLKDTIGGTTVQDMSAAQLKALSDAYTMVLTTIRNANKAFTDGRSIQAEAEQMAAEFRSRKIPEKALGIAAKKVMDSIGWNYEKLHYALDRIGSPTLSRLFNNLADSENITMRDVQEAKAYQKEMVEKYHYNDWKIDQKIDHPFVDNTGKEFHLTLGELMALYAYSRRDGADRHIEYGGFKLGKSALTDPKPATTYKLTAEQLAKITEMLTEEQRTFAEGMQKYLSETMGAKGNEVSMKLYGIEMFKEENYFPLHIAGEFKAQAQESQAKAAAGFQTMSNAGFTQTRNKESTAPIVLEDFMSVWADHVNEMARYHGAVPALEDIRRVMNYSVYSDADSESMSVEAAMTNAFGKQAVQYFDNLYREANSGAITDKLDAAPKKMLSLFRKNAVAYSVSVWIQQPASIYRARMMVDRKYFGRHGFFTLTGGVLRILNRKKWNTTYEEMMRYAPGVTMAKEIGGFDTSTGSSIRSYLMDTEKSFFQSMKNDTAKDKAKSVLKLVDDNAIANLPNVMDKVAWIEMWEACKRETVARNPQMETDSKAFLEKVGHRFTEVIRGTQVYDSMFAKSPMLKTNNLFVQSAVSFMNESNTVANMAEATIRDLARGNKKQAAKTASALVTSIVANELLKSIVYAMRDDDEDETLLEKYISAVAGSLIDDVTVFNYVPYARDVWSVWQGYDAERADMAIVSDAVSAVKKLSQLSGEDAAAMTEEELLKWSEEVTDARWAVAETLSPLFGIPLKNIRRDMLAVFNAVKIRGLDKERQSTALSIRHTVEDAIWQGSKSGADRLYEAMVAGDDAYVQRLRNNYKSDDAYHTAIKKALRDNDSRIWEAAVAWNAGELETYIRIAKEIRGEGRFDQDDIVLAIRAEANSMLEKDDSSSDKVYGYFTAEKFGVAMSQGNTTMVDMIRQDLIDTDIANGKTREEAEKSVQRKARTQLKELYTGGTISASTAEKMLVKYAGKSYEEADELVSEWQFDMDYPDSDISFSDYQKWEDNGKGLGISLGIYTEYKTRTKGIENDKDVNGNSIPYTAVQKIMTVINSLPLSESQKYALARSQGWSEKTIQKYKQW